MRIADMSRHSRTQSSDATFVVIVLVGAAAWTHRAELERIAFIALALLGCALVLRIGWKYFAYRRSKGLGSREASAREGPGNCGVGFGQANHTVYQSPERKLRAGLLFEKWLHGSELSLPETRNSSFIVVVY